MSSKALKITKPFFQPIKPKNQRLRSRTHSETRLENRPSVAVAARRRTPRLPTGPAAANASAQPQAELPETAVVNVYIRPVSAELTNEKLVTVKEAAGLLGKSKDTIY